MKFLFYVAKKYSIPIVSPLIFQLLETKEDFALFVSQAVQEVLPREWKYFKYLGSIKETIQYQPDCVFVPGNFVDFRIPGIKVQIFHGLGVEKKSHFKIRHFFDVYLTSGPFVTEQFNEMQKKFNYFLVEETGWPKIDYIVKYPNENLKEKLSIPADKKIILYAPTFSNKMQSATDLLPIIPQIIKPDELWLMKFHDLMDREIIEQIKNERSAQIRFIDTYDITPFLHVADLLISDTSSVVYEFMALDKPIITYRTQSREDKGINIFNPVDLREAIDRSLTDPDEFHQNRMDHLRQINPNLDGKISERVFEILKDIHTNHRLPNKKKPLNLFRKYQIIYHEKFKKGYLR